MRRNGSSGAVPPKESSQYMSGPSIHTTLASSSRPRSPGRESPVDAQVETLQGALDKSLRDWLANLQRASEDS